MPDPHETLSIFAEVSVALVGFSGIVIAFGRRSLGSLSNLEKRRLSNLFSLSGLALLASLLVMALSHVDLSDPQILWRGASATLLLLSAPWLIWDMFKVRRLQALEKSQVNAYLLYSFNSVAVAMLFLQLANWLVIRQPWPFFLALVLVVAGALQQFILLVRTGFHDP